MIFGRGAPDSFTDGLPRSPGLRRRTTALFAGLRRPRQGDELRVRQPLLAPPDAVLVEHRLDLRLPNDVAPVAEADGNTMGAESRLVTNDREYLVDERSPRARVRLR